MFGKLKEKLKGWVKSAKDKITSGEEEEEIIEEVKKEKVTKTKKEEKKKVKEEEKKLKKEEKEKKKQERKKKKEKVTPGIATETEDKDEAQILSEQPAKVVAQVLEEKEGETAKDVNERIEDVKEEIIEKEEEEKPEKVKEKIKKAEELIEEIKDKDEKIKEPPVKYDVAKHKYEPDLERIKKEKPKIQEEEQEEGKKGFFAKLKSSFSYKINKEEFDELFDDLEMLLLENNVALEVVEDIKQGLSERLIGREIKKNNLEQEIITELKSTLNELLIEPDDPLDIIKMKKQESKDPFVILFFGINGTGKTTSIAKITKLLQKNNFSVVLAAADTFRAASIEQIQEHATRLKVPLIKHDYNADPSAVAFDAIKYAKNHSIDVVLIDTAGRMHTKTNLLNEMEKIVRVTKPDLKIFVAESIAGNDATEQARSFHDMIEIDGSILSKADIDEKGGTIVSVSHTTHKPIFYLGTGQNYEDLELFDKQKFIENLFG
ncbi:signal recognition particle-docking protein FtsY [Candidatus Pacearchaeota archaeon]|nr:signal recognition particle-docking protein FtsY [Candidatus Pacearchaeota archaeon]